MQSVELTWVPSTSVGVNEQQVRIVDTATQEVYGEAVLSADASSYMTSCPEGVTIIGIVDTIRGEQVASAQSAPFDVPYAPLNPATGLALGLAPQIQPVVARR